MIIQTTQIKKKAEEFFKKITDNFKIDVCFKKDTVLVNVYLEFPEVFIGKRGQTLAEIQHLLKIVFKKKTKEIIYLDLDINDYKKKKIQYLKEVIKTIADEVIFTKKEKYLPPMLAYERRIIHLEIAKRKDVSSESVGRESERRILISPL